MPCCAAGSVGWYGVLRLRGALLRTLRFAQDDRVGKKAPIVGSDCEDRRVKIGCEERSDLKVGLKIGLKEER